MGNRMTVSHLGQRALLNLMTAALLCTGLAAANTPDAAASLAAAQQTLLAHFRQTAATPSDMMRLSEPMLRIGSDTRIPAEKRLELLAGAYPEILDPETAAMIVAESRGQAGDPELQFRLGMHYYNWNGAAGMPAIVDYNHAAYWLRKAAQQGHARAQYFLGICYANGDGVTRNMYDAVKWWLKAAAQDVGEAQYLLAYCYLNGMGTEKNPGEAGKWYRRCAERGSAEAQFWLGECYDQGIGVEQDSAEAVKWYRKAAAQNHRLAQFSLGLCHAVGDGVEKNAEEADKWFKLAADQGLEAASYCLDRIANADSELNLEPQDLAAEREELKKMLDNAADGVLMPDTFGPEWNRIRTELIAKVTTMLYKHRKEPSQRDADNIKMAVDLKFRSILPDPEKADLNPSVVLRNTAATRVDKMKEYQYDEAELLKQEADLARKKYPLYKEGDIVELRIAVGSSPARTYRGAYRKCGLSRIWVGQSIINKVDLPASLKPCFDKKLNAAAIQEELGRHVLITRIRKAKEREIDRQYEMLLAAQYEKNLPRGYLLVSGWWRKPSEVAEFTIRQIKQEERNAEKLRKAAAALKARNEGGTEESHPNGSNGEAETEEPEKPEEL